MEHREPITAEPASRGYRADRVALALVAGLFALGLAFFTGRSCGSAHVDSATAADEPAPAIADLPAAKPAPPPPEPAVTQPPAAPEPKAGSSAWPKLEGPGFKTSRTAGELTVRFNYPAFSRGTELAPAACQDLRRIAVVLTPVMSGFRLEIEGHTDNASVGSGKAYANNQALGLARAQVVVDYLTKQCGLPTDALAATSAGDTRPPYPNTTPENRRMNRTVVLKLRQATADR